MWSAIAHIWLERLVLKPEWADFMSERTERPDEGGGQTNKMTDQRKFSWVLREFFPLGTAAKKKDQE